ncbi:MAG: hypothetical protein U0Q16_15290 [Bryobacteraceae bacterium]
MSSRQRIIASRKNGRQSRGPVTPEGKSRSSQNSISHGLSAQTIVLSSESAERFDNLLTALTEVYLPANDVEMLCVEQMAAAQWKLRRSWAIEAALLDHELDRISSGIERTQDQADQPTRLALAYRSLQDHTASLPSLHRHQTRLENQYDKAVKRLAILQESREKIDDLTNEPNSDPEPSETPSN